MSESEVRVVVAGYRDLVRVGSGGFSMVYRAYQEAFDRTVAVKVLTVELVDETAQRRFQRECRASGRLSNHPNIVTVLDSGFTEDGRPYIVTEFMSHGSLADRLTANGPYPVAEVLDIGVKMCGALAAVHAAGILHRDIKPPNILVSDYGEPALADFGISAITVGPDASIGTSSITPLHVAPEILEGQPTSQASDVYALGSTLYTLLAGRAPFQEGDDDALLPLMRRVVMDPVPPIDRPDLSSAVFDVLRYSMEKQPFARYPTALSFGEALEALQAHLGQPVTPLRRPGSPSTDQSAPLDAAVPADVPVASAGMPVAAAHASGVSAGPVGAVGAASPPGTDAPRGSRGGSRAGVLTAVGVLAVVAIIAAAIMSRAASGPSGGETSGAPGSSAPGGSGGPVDAQVITLGAPAAGSGLRFDIDSANIDPSTPTPGGTLRVAIDTEPGSWNPAASRLVGGSALVAESIFDPLAVLADDGAHPYLATAVTPNATFDEWTIEIPAGVRFHDGAELSAADVKANFDARLADELMAPLLAPVSAVDVVEGTVVVKTRQPWPAFLVALTGSTGLIASPSTLTEAPAHPVGTGPFAFESYEPGSRVTVTRNGSYRLADRPYLDGIVFSIVPDADVRRSGLESGDLDIVYTNDPVALDALSSSFTVLQARQSVLGCVVFNTDDPVLSDVHLRQALAAAIDRTALVDQVFEGKAWSTDTFLPSTSPWAYSETESQYFDTDRVRSLLEQVGPAVPRPLTVTLQVGSSTRQQQVGAFLQAQWQAVGIDTVVQTPDDTLQPVVDGTFQAALWTYDVPTDPDELYRWFHSDPATGTFPYNLPRFASSSVDKGLEKGRRSASPEDRLSAYAEVAKGLNDEAPGLWFAYLPTALVANPNVIGWKVETMGGVGRGGTPWATELGFA